MQHESVSGMPQTVTREHCTEVVGDQCSSISYTDTACSLSSAARFHKVASALHVRSCVLPCISCTVYTNPNLGGYCHGPPIQCWVERSSYLGSIDEKLLLYLLYSFRSIWVFYYPPHLTKDISYLEVQESLPQVKPLILWTGVGILSVSWQCCNYSDVTITSSFVFGYRVLHYHLPLSCTVKMFYKSHPSPSTGLFWPFHGWRWGACVPSHVPKVNVLLMLSSIVRYGHPISSPELGAQSKEGHTAAWNCLLWSLLYVFSFSQPFYGGKKHWVTAEVR